MSHWEIKPAPVLSLAFWSDTLLAELSHPTIHRYHSAVQSPSTPSPVNVDMGLVSDSPFSGVLSLLDDSDDTLVNVWSVWLAMCRGSEDG